PVEGTENFLVMGEPGFQLWKKKGPPGNQSYILYDSLPLPGDREGLTRGPGNRFYCLRDGSIDKIETIDAGLNYLVLPLSLFVIDFSAMAVDDQYLYLMDYFGNGTRVLRCALQQQNVMSLLEVGPGFQPSALALNDGWIAVGGHETSGIF